MNIKRVTIALCLLALGCSPETESYDEIDARPFSAEPVMELRDSEDILFGSISDVRVASDGAILVADGNRQRIHLFDSGGGYLDSALREGGGPGEVELMRGDIGLTGRDTLLVYDQAMRRVSLFDFTGDDLTPLRDVPLEPFVSGFHLLPGPGILLNVRVDRPAAELSGR